VAITPVQRPAPGCLDVPQSGDGQPCPLRAGRRARRWPAFHNRQVPRPNLALHAPGHGRTRGTRSSHQRRTRATSSSGNAVSATRQVCQGPEVGRRSAPRPPAHVRTAARQCPLMVTSLAHWSLQRVREFVRRCRQLEPNDYACARNAGGCAQSIYIGRVYFEWQSFMTGSPCLQSA
jgi:hypothetical protein